MVVREIWFCSIYENASPLVMPCDDGYVLVQGSAGKANGGLGESGFTLRSARPKVDLDPT